MRPANKEVAEASMAPNRLFPLVIRLVPLSFLAALLLGMGAPVHALPSSTYRNNTIAGNANHGFYYTGMPHHRRHRQRLG
jgi:hypothetical protein